MKQKISIHTEAERLKCLACAPGIIFMIVASADGEIDKKELKRFASLMASKEYTILVSMLEQAGASISDLLDEILTHRLDPYQELQMVCSILDVYLSENAAKTYKLTLLRLAQGIAKPPAIMFGLFGGKTNQKQESAIAIVAKLLGLLDGVEQQRSDQDIIALSRNEKTSYSSVTALPDQLFPVLKSSDWAEKVNSTVLTTRIDNQAKPTSKEPVVAYAVDSPELVDFLSSNAIDPPLTNQQIHDYALRNLEQRMNRCVEWRALEFDTGNKQLGSLSGLVLSGDYYCSEAIFSQTVLKHAHQQLQSELLIAITPIRGELYVTRLENERRPEPSCLVFAQFAVSRFFNPQQVQISPNIWVIRDGKLVGPLAGMEEITNSAEQCALQSQQCDNQFIHTVKTYSEEKGIGIQLDVVAKDLGEMMSSLQHLIRSYVEQGIQQQSFSGNLRVHLDIQAPDYDSDMKVHIAEQLETMSHFLCRQFSSLGIKTANNTEIKLSCSVID